MKNDKIEVLVTDSQNVNLLGIALDGGHIPRGVKDGQFEAVLILLVFFQTQRYRTANE